jgi:hypothetical protein
MASKKATRAKKAGFARLTKARCAEISALGGKALAKKRKAALKVVLQKHLKEKAAAKPAKTAAKRK